MINRLPAWFKQEIPDKASLEKIHSLLERNIHTVCQAAKCPNLSHCFTQAKLTFMLLGDICTRHCSFCAVKKANNRPLKLDLEEPHRVAETVKGLNLNYVVITSVTRDDLEDCGAGVFAKTIALIRKANKNIKVEALIPDFRGSIASLKILISASPDVVAHNIETVPRLYAELRPQADYRRSLEVLRKIKEINLSLTTKSSLMLGLGEAEVEVISTMKDLRDNQCDILALGQYLAPSDEHYPVKEFISMEQFSKYKEIGLALGFRTVLSGPLVRSSYEAEEAYNEFVHV